MVVADTSEVLKLMVQDDADNSDSNTQNLLQLASSFKNL
ncbi:hypothetical protein yaldo0001_23230 [Yersinia aldovae ATCC 35236]|nr:hypothetical protein yaldo0001_23230 [Yersinia aldovae ATCC 35236]